MQDIDTERQEMVNDPKLRSLILPDYPMDWLDFYFCDSFGTPLDYEDIIERLEQGKNLIRFGYR